MSGIAVAGTLVTDVIKMISHYPVKGMLADVYNVSWGIGGAVSNTSVGVKMLDPETPVYGIGLTGNDDMGHFLKEKLAGYGIDVSGISATDLEPTAFSDVMTISDTGERTFFHNRGANRLFDGSCLGLPAPGDQDKMTENKLPDIDLILLAYGGLLDALNESDEIYGTKQARLCHDLQEKGIAVAMDVASTRDAEEMQRLVIPSLKYTDYLIVNEVEAGMITGIDPRDEENRLIPEAMEKMCRRALELGVRQCCVIHAPEMGCAADVLGGTASEPSLNLPEGFIAGAVGAGDAFCAGILYSIYKKLPLQDALKLAAANAAANLSASDSVSGLRNLDRTMELYRKYHR